MVRTVHIAMRQGGKEIIQRFTGLDRADHPRNALRLLSRLEALPDRGQMNAHLCLAERLMHGWGTLLVLLRTSSGSL